MRNLIPMHKATPREQLRAKSERRFTCSLASLQIQMQEARQDRAPAPPRPQAGNSGWSHAA
jgi:hypothetical protein